MFFVDLEPQSNNKKVYDLQFINRTRVTIEPPRKKRGLIQCMRCQGYGHSKAYCYRPFNCVKCGEQHDTKICQKDKNTPAKCVLCNGNHPANYRGCQVYKNLLKINQPRSSIRQPSSAPNTPQKIPMPSNNQIPQQQIPRTYAEATRTGKEEQTTFGLNQQLTALLDEFKSMFSQLLNQNSMILNLLTTLISKMNP